jgi:lysozyme
VNDITRARLLADLREDEGWRARPYQDSVGVWTVGYGHNLQDGPALTRRAGGVILEDDLAAAEGGCSTLPWYADLDEVRQAVVANMVLNMGIGRFSKFKLTIAAIRAARYDEAAREMLDSTWARQVGSRAHRLAEQMRTGVWQ